MRTIFCLCLILAFTASSFAQSQPSKTAYSFTLHKIGKGNGKLVSSGDKFKVKALSGKFSGRFHKIQDNHMYWIVKEDTTKLPLSQMVHLKPWRDPLSSTVGVVLKVAGVSAMIAGPIAVGAGALAGSESTQENLTREEREIADAISLGLMAGGGFAVPAGFGITKLGDLAMGKKYKLHSKYTISPIY